MLGTTINLTTEAGGSDLISSVGMISTDFFLQMFVFFRSFLIFCFSLVYYTTFSFVSCAFLSVFGHMPLQERRDGRSPQPSLY